MPKKILVADGSPTERELILSLLREHGYEVLLAEDGVKTLSIAHLYKPDLMLLDKSIPVLPAEQVCRELKQSVNLNGILVIMILSKDEVKKKHELKLVGADAFIVKPFNPNELLEQVENLLSKKEASPSDEVSANASEPKEPQKTIVPTHQNEKADDRLDIIEASALMENLELSMRAGEEGVHGFEWFLSELQKETQEDKKADSHPEEKPILSERKIPGKSAGAIVSDTSRPPFLRDSMLEKISLSELDQLFSDLKEKISEKIAQEIARKISPEFIEKIIREEMSKLRKESLSSSEK